MIELDALIIGKGPAGVQAALYMYRANVRPLIIGKDLGASEQAQVVDNFYGYPSIRGPELIEIGIKQATDMGIEVVTDEVLSIRYEDEKYIVTTPLTTYKVIALLLATGTQRTIPRVRKIRNFHGKGVSYCAVCDAFFYRNKTVGVLGNASYAAHEAAELVEICDKVYVFTDGKDLEAEFDPRCIIITDKLKTVLGDEKVSGLETDLTVINLDGIFVALGSASSTDIATQIGLEIANGRIVVNSEQETMIPGLYAAGDCTPGPQQIAKAVSDGCIAGMNMVSYVRTFKRRQV
ncbi:MAG TPA: FAD-dependent oxidoreductase [Erysipelothrix sp.]|nr:FAD-dependent oxidoreductase [Erysipelothrix sp.]